MLNRLAGASLRAVLVAAAVTIPALLLPGVSNASTELAILSGTLAAAFVIFEYGFTSPSLIEFRFAAPYNRVRFIMFAALLLALSIVFRTALHDTGSKIVVTDFAHSVFDLWNFPGSPVRAFMNMAGPMTSESAQLIGAAAAMALTITTVTMGMFAAVVALFSWPVSRDSFNLWVNMPTFENTSEDQAQDALRQSAFISLVIGLTLPYLAPQAASAFLGPLQPISTTNSLFFVWMIAIWCFVPAISVLRAIALYKVANLLADFADSDS